MRIILLGDAGAGKSTMARRLAGGRGIARLSLDGIAWREGAAERKPLAESLEALRRFLRARRRRCSSRGAGGSASTSVATTSTG